MTKVAIMVIYRAPAIIDDLKRKFGTSTYRLQEQIKNHHLLSNIYLNSLKTLRLHTILNRDGIMDFVSILQRFGAHESIINDGYLGGMNVCGR